MHDDELIWNDPTDSSLTAFSCRLPVFWYGSRGCIKERLPVEKSKFLLKEGSDIDRVAIFRSTTPVHHFGT